MPNTFTTIPAEVDQIFIDAWSTRFAGNVKNLPKLIMNYFTTYSQYILHQPEYTLGSITAEQIRIQCTNSSPSAPGLDNWVGTDFKLLSDIGFQWLADIFNAVENGAPWPKGVLRAKSSYLEKDPSKPDDPLATRSLLITAALYRLWASTRLHHLEPWIRSWATDDMFAGIPGVGAADAWYSTAITIEHSTLHNIPLTGGSADIRKCFDEIQRPLLYLLAYTAGIPRTFYLPT